MIILDADGIVGLVLQQATKVRRHPEVPNRSVLERRIAIGRRTHGAVAVEIRTEGTGWR
jgi:hypothetical protein